MHRGPQDHRGGRRILRPYTRIIDEDSRASIIILLRLWCRLLVRICIEDLKIIEGGAVSYSHPPTPEPSTTSRTGRAGQTFKHRDAGQATRGSISLDGSQSEGCGLQTGRRRVTTGASRGGRQTKQQTDREEAIGGEIYYVRAMCLGGQGTQVKPALGRGLPEPSLSTGKSST